MIQTAAGAVPRKTYLSRIDEIINSFWQTQDLVGFALYWDTTGPKILAGTESAKPVWGTVASTQDEARDYYDRLATDDPEQLRWEAAEALVVGGFTRSIINHRKS